MKNQKLIEKIKEIIAKAKENGNQEIEDLGNEAMRIVEPPDDDDTGQEKPPRP